MTIVCEIGQNHCGNIELAKVLIYLAKLNGGDKVKLQFYRHDMLYKDHPEIPDVSLDDYQAADLFFYGQKIGIEVFFSVFDVLGVHILDDMGVQRYKVAYSQRNNRNLIEAIESTGKPYMVSVDEEILVPWDKYKPQFIRCVPKYPARLEDYLFTPYHVGVSDHTIGLELAKMAIRNNLKIIEKHFALSHDIGIDAEWSMTPGELKQLKEYECKLRA